MKQDKLMEQDNLTLMAVHAHPDDESIGTGGILAKYAAMGVRTVVVYCTRGEEGDLNNPDFVVAEPGMSMEDIRMKELENALAVLGISETFFLGYRDSGMAGNPKNKAPRAFARADVDTAARHLADILRETRPQVVVTYNEKGLYGHPDHIMANRVTVRAIDLAQDPAYSGKKEFAPWPVQKFYYTAVSLERMRKMQQLAQQQGEDIGIDPEFLGTPDEMITTTVDVGDFLPKKFEAILCHKSQIGPESFFRRVPQDRLNEFFKYEHYVCVFGCSVKHKEDDLFEGLW
jgi:N-acetyl-1-D-myo-inositol-2-amino-2-deoxy-alpha-D-glucopyranoside deacetylase